MYVDFSVEMLRVFSLFALQAADVVEFAKASNARIAQLQGDLAKWENMVPVDQMTMEEFFEAFPDQVIFFF